MIRVAKLFYLQQYFSALGTVPTKSFTGAFSSSSCLDVRMKTSSQSISTTLLQILLKLHEHGGDYRRKKLPWTILEEQFPVPRNTPVRKIGNSVISLLCQLRRHCNPDHNKFSSLSTTIVVAIFPNCFVLGYVVYAQTWKVLTLSSYLKETVGQQGQATLVFVFHRVFFHPLGSARASDSPHSTFTWVSSWSSTRITK